MDGRTRTYSWEDPLASLERMAGSGLNGLDAIRQIMNGEIPPPPISDTLDFRLVEVEHGRVVFECEPAEFHYNPIGVVHAGLAVTLLDSAMGCAFVTTLELKANFTRALTKDTGTVRCVGTMVHSGRRVATTDARIEDPQGRLCAHATSTILVL